MDINNKKFQTSPLSTSSKLLSNSNTITNNKAINDTFDDLLKQLDEAENQNKMEINDNSSKNRIGTSTPSTVSEDMAISQRSGNVYGGQTTDRGTRIIQPGEDMDKNAFLRILAAQMSNQDPTQPQDGTEYVSQFAQFAAMEQMSNLNITMSGFAAQSLIGKGVMLNAYDKLGNAITGIVRSVAQSGSKTLVGIEYYDEQGKLVMGEFENDDIANVIDVPDNRLDYINNNMAMLVGSSMIDKDIEFLVMSSGDSSTIPEDTTIDTSNKDEGVSGEVNDKIESGDNITHEQIELRESKLNENNNSSQYKTKMGRVESVVVENFMIQLRVRVYETDEVETVSLDKVIRVDGEEYKNEMFIE